MRETEMRERQEEIEEKENESERESLKETERQSDRVSERQTCKIAAALKVFSFPQSATHESSGGSPQNPKTPQ